ncbi:hypothetical protein ACTFEL_06375, partial [Campylobacter jejuni]
GLMNMSGMKDDSTEQEPLQPDFSNYEGSVYFPFQQDDDSNSATTYSAAPSAFFSPVRTNAEVPSQHTGS